MTSTITVLLTNDGTKHEIDVALTITLNELRDKIYQCTSLQQNCKTKKVSRRMLKPVNQRIFHLGRELKTGKRSLQGLGIGKFDVYTVHLTSKVSVPTAGQRRVNGSNGDVDGDDDGDGDAKNGTNSSSSAAADTLEVLSSDDDDDIIVRGSASRNSSSNSNADNDARHQHRESKRKNAGERTVLEILSSDDEEDNDEVELLSPSTVENIRQSATSKRQRRR